MKTGIEKFTNIMDDETCTALINHLKEQIKYDNVNECNHGQDYENVECKQTVLVTGSDLDNAVRSSMYKITNEYALRYSWFGCESDSHYQLRKITNNTKLHVDNIFTHDPMTRHKLRIISVIIGLNSDYEDGEFHFPYHDYKTTIKRGEAIAFPVYFTYPHSVSKPIGNRYTINTWFFENSRDPMIG